MDLHQLVSSYGALGLFAGSALEGEAVAMLGGVMSHRGLLPFRDAVLAVAGGSLLVDQTFFLLGRQFRDHPRVRAVQASVVGGRVMRTFQRHPDLFAFGFRFLYGLRIASAITIGTTDFPLGRMIVLNALASLVWASLSVSVGYLSGQAIEAAFGRLHDGWHFGLSALMILLALALIAGLSRRALRSRQARSR